MSFGEGRHIQIIALWAAQAKWDQLRKNQKTQPRQESEQIKDPVSQDFRTIPRASELGE
jgi:hypothetical protein